MFRSVTTYFKSKRVYLCIEKHESLSVLRKYNSVDSYMSRDRTKDPKEMHVVTLQGPPQLDHLKLFTIFKTKYVVKTGNTDTEIKKD